MDTESYPFNVDYGQAFVMLKNGRKLVLRIPRGDVLALRNQLEDQMKEKFRVIPVLQIGDETHYLLVEK